MEVFHRLAAFGQAAILAACLAAVPVADPIVAVGVKDAGEAGAAFAIEIGRGGVSMRRHSRSPKSMTP